MGPITPGHSYACFLACFLWHDISISAFFVLVEHLATCMVML